MKRRKTGGCFEEITLIQQGTGYEAMFHQGDDGRISRVYVYAADVVGMRRAFPKSFRFKPTKGNSAFMDVVSPDPGKAVRALRGTGFYRPGGER